MRKYVQPANLSLYIAARAFLLTAGVMILIKKRARAAAMALGVMILAVAALTYAFRVAGHVGNLGELINTLKDVAVAGGAFILAGILPFETRSVVAPQLFGEAVQSLNS
jgi:hypothetical protein